MLAAAVSSPSLLTVNGVRPSGAAMRQASGEKAVTGDTDAKLRALMVLAQAGDRAAYRSVLDTARVQLAAYFRYRLKEDPASADDLVQETLIAIHTKRATYDARHPFMPWLYAIARYKLIDHYRRYRVRRTEPEEAAGALPMKPTTPAPRWPGSIWRPCLRACLPVRPRPYAGQS